MAPSQRIAFVANTSWSIYKFRLYTIERLIQGGFEVYVLAPRDTYTGRFEHLPGLIFFELRHLRAKSISPLQDLLLYNELLTIYRCIAPSLIFHYTIKANVFGSLAARRAGIPAISVITGLGYTFTGNGWLRKTVSLLYRRALRHNAEVWVLNEDDRALLAAEHLADPKKIFVLPGEGVDTEAFFPAPYNPGEKRAITFLFIGRMIRPKGVYEFVRAAEKLKEQGLSVSCQLLGFFDDNPSAIPRREIEQWGDRRVITWLGQTDQVADYIEQADCIVLPSYYGEGMPMSLLEGGSMCKALIAGDGPGCRTLIEDGTNGYLCKTRDSTDLANKMATYYNLPPPAKRQMGMAARQKILGSFTREHVAAIYIDKIKILTA